MLTRLDAFEQLFLYLKKFKNILHVFFQNSSLLNDEKHKISLINSTFLFRLTA